VPLFGDFSLLFFFSSLFLGVPYQGETCAI
jgi:hypothetical protein